MRTHVCASVSACACSCAYAYASAWAIMQVADTVGLQKRYVYKTKQYVYRQVLFTNTKQNKKFTNTLFTKQNKIKVYRQVMFTKQDKTNVYKTKVYKHVMFTKQNTTLFLLSRCVSFEPFQNFSVFHNDDFVNFT